MHRNLAILSLRCTQDFDIFLQLYTAGLFFLFYVYFAVDYSGFLFKIKNKKEEKQKISLSRIHLPTHMNKDEGSFNCYRTYFAALDIWVRSQLLISVIISLDMDKSND